MPENQSRFDFYAPVHKGIRRSLADLLVRLGACDFGNPEQTASLLAELRAQLALGDLHLRDEERVIHPRLVRASAGEVRALAEEHEEHRAKMREVERCIRALEAAAGADRPRAGHALYLCFSAYVADDLRHMHREEVVTLKELHANFSDEELAGMEQEIVSGLDPDQFAAFVRVMAPAATPEERVSMVAHLRAVMPAHDFAALLDEVIRPSLSDAEWRHLEGRLLAPA